MNDSGIESFYLFQKGKNDLDPNVRQFHSAEASDLPFIEESYAYTDIIRTGFIS